MLKPSKYAKKTAEVAAFAAIGLEMLERSEVKIFTDANLSKLKREFKEQLLHALKYADKDKTDKTTVKLRKMMQDYIGDEWDNKTEILEWSGFFFGAAMVHWGLVAGLSDSSLDNSFASKQLEKLKYWLEMTCREIVR